MKFNLSLVALIACGYLVTSCDSGWLTSLAQLKTVFGEVCQFPSINYESSELEKTLREKVFGQPFIEKLLVPLISHHMDDKVGNRKALVLSFHGTPGSGKNYVAKILAESMYQLGMDSKFVHLFKPILHFSGQPAEVLKLRLQQWILGNVTICHRQLFIFDEINDMPEGILEAVKGFIDYNPRFGGLDFSKCIFIFLSNIAMVPINQRVLELWQDGTKSRDKLKHEDFTSIIIEHSFNEDGGFKKSKLLTSRLVDAFIPFLPLEKSHVESCIKVIAKEYSAHAPLTPPMIDYIMENVEFAPENLKLYSVHGCKNLDTPIKLVLMRLQRHVDEL